MVAGALVSNLDSGKTSFLFTPSGDREKQLKTHLFGNEVGGLTPGSSLKVFKVETFSLGIAVCGDLYFPEVVRVYGLKGADVVYCPTTVCLPKGFKNEKIVKAFQNLIVLSCRSRAFENSLFTVLVNVNLKDDVIKEQLEGKVHWSSVEWEVMPEYEDGIVIRETNVRVPIITVGANPILRSLRSLSIS